MYTYMSVIFESIKQIISAGGWNPVDFIIYMTNVFTQCTLYKDIGVFFSLLILNKDIRC